MGTLGANGVFRRVELVRLGYRCVVMRRGGCRIFIGIRRCRFVFFSGRVLLFFGGLRVSRAMLFRVTCACGRLRTAT